MDTFTHIHKNAKIAVLGAGSWGTALAILLAANGHSIQLWARDASLITTLVSQKENLRYLPGMRISPNISPTTSLIGAITGAQVIVIAVPSGGVRWVAQEIAPYISPDILIISAAKGLEEGTGLRMSQVIDETIPGCAAQLTALSGPNLAVEVARGAPTASVAASVNPAASRAAQRLFTGQQHPTFRVYGGHDVIGVEIAGAIKNVIAIAAGVSDGKGFGDNSKAALMTRGLSEAIRLGVSQGAEAKTFLGLSGVGDMIATGGSRLSRNYRVGFALGQGRTLPDILKELDQVAEGVPTTRVLCELAHRSQIELPLCMALRDVLFHSRSASDVIRDLMLRPPKHE